MKLSNKRTLLIVLLSLMLLLATTAVALADKPAVVDGNGVEVAWHDTGCAKIQSGDIGYSPIHYLYGQPLETGFNEFGYNYQAHMFSGSYVNTYLGSDGFPPYAGDDAAYAQRLLDEGYTTNPYSKWYWPHRDVDLLMKWDDMWISNSDCDGDDLLDRHWGFTSYVGSGAWLTNHMSGQGPDNWTYFTKIVAAPSDAIKTGTNWYSSDGVEIGPVIWGDFATIEEVESGVGATYVSPSGPGFGQF